MTSLRWPVAIAIDRELYCRADSDRVRTRRASFRRENIRTMDLQVILLLVAALLIAVALSAPLADRLGLSPSVLLALVGIVIGLTSMYLMRAEGLERFASVANVIVNLPFHSDAFLFIFLPILLFEASLNIEVRRMVEDAAPILLLAVVAVLSVWPGISLTFMPTREATRALRFKLF
jgi:CPA1 family monovalent cation:H+ antiporter